MTIDEKYDILKQYMLSLESVAVAFSGGVDSTFLLQTAKDVLGDKVMAVTSVSCLFPEREIREAKAFCQNEGIRHILFGSEELAIEGFRRNPMNRCYLCKKELFKKMKMIAAEHGIKYVAEGSNLDDNGDYRPGLQAVAELDIKSPLRLAGLTKVDIRELSRKKGLKTYMKPSFACLASRFPYGEEISEQKLEMVDKAEQFLFDLGLHQLRVRIHGTVARIEVEEQDFPRLMEKANRGKIVDELKSYGFTYVSLDLQGYRTGSMNEMLEEGNHG